MRTTKPLLATTLTLLLSGCTQQAMQPSPAPTETPCPEPRPQICTMDYRPVCGQGYSGEQRTFSNGCAACGDDSMRAYIDTACPES